MVSSTFRLGLCYNTHTIFLRLLKEDPNERLYKILLASFIFSSFHFFLYEKKGENIDNTIKDIKVSSVHIAANHCHEMCNMFGIVNEVQKNVKITHTKDN